MCRKTTQEGLLASGLAYTATNLVLCYTPTCLSLYITCYHMLSIGCCLSAAYAKWFVYISQQLCSKWPNVQWIFFLRLKLKKLLFLLAVLVPVLLLVFLLSAQHFPNTTAVASKLSSTQKQQYHATDCIKPVILFQAET